MYVINSGYFDYERCHELQKKIVIFKENNFPDVLILVEHPPVITIGHRGKKENILISEEELKKRNISVLRIERGGDVTYHGPGQLVGYPIIKLTDYKLKVREFIERLEEVLIVTLKNYNITGTRNEINHGVWIGNNKIASIGIGIRRWITFHGFALNVNTHIEEFNMIKACGLDNTGIVSMKKIAGKEFPLSEVSGIICHNFSKIFNISLEEISYEEFLMRFFN
ncbi:MAG: lipoyl(octanoyl) transferase LipB [Candidatus Eremiobacterota bacterium]